MNKKFEFDFPLVAFDMFLVKFNVYSTRRDNKNYRFALYGAFAVRSTKKCTFYAISYRILQWKIPRAHISKWKSVRIAVDRFSSSFLMSAFFHFRNEKLAVQRQCNCCTLHNLHCRFTISRRLSLSFFHIICPFYLSFDAILLEHIKINVAI